MGKASRTKRTRAVVRSAKRSRQNTWWYSLTALVVIVGIALIVYARESAPSAVGPYIMDQGDPDNPRNKDAHWHAALGVYACDRWLSDGSGDGVWTWPAATPSQSPARAKNTNLYAGLHSHSDGIIHMEPQVSEEAGRNATVGKYFDFGGWEVSTDGFDFLGTKMRNGDKCGSTAGRLQWAVAKLDRADPSKKLELTPRVGDPGDYKLFNDDVVVLAFLPEGASIGTVGNPPSVANLPDADENEARPGATMPPVTTAPSTPTTAGSPTTASPASPTTPVAPTTQP
jgi:hypothetical protein